MDATGNVNVYNPDKQISEQVTLKTIVMHDSAMKLARSGLPDIPMEKPLTYNERINLRFKGLREVIASQQSMITNIARPIIKINCMRKWEKMYKEDEEKATNPFDKEDNDYNELLGILSFLDECEQRIIRAKQTKKIEDDFIWEKTDHNGDTILELTDNFFAMFKELEESFEAIYGLLLSHRIVSSGAMEDEDVTERQKEEEAMRRIVEA